MKTVEQNRTKLRFNVEDVDETAAVLRRKGVAIEVESYSWGTIANATDPERQPALAQGRGEFSVTLFVRRIFVRDRRGKGGLSELSLELASPMSRHKIRNY